MGIRSIIQNFFHVKPRIRTFDLACEYLKDVNWNYVEGDFITGKSVIIAVHNKYKEDIRNNLSNDFYRDSVFEAAIWHCKEINKGGVSAFEEACEIINDLKDKKQFLVKKWHNTTYPNIMVDLFMRWCESLQPPKSYLESEEMRMCIFAVAHAYVTEKKS